MKKCVCKFLGAMLLVGMVFGSAVNADAKVVDIIQKDGKNYSVVNHGSYDELVEIKCANENTVITNCNVYYVLPIGSAGNDKPKVESGLDSLRIRDIRIRNHMNGSRQGEKIHKLQEEAENTRKEVNMNHSNRG